MASNSGTSEAGIQIVMDAGLSERTNIVVFPPDLELGRPRRLGYLWYGFTDGPDFVPLIAGAAPLTNYGFTAPNFTIHTPTWQYCTIIVEWNVSGIAWLSFC